MVFVTETFSDMWRVLQGLPSAPTPPGALFLPLLCSFGLIVMDYMVMWVR